MTPVSFRKDSDTFKIYQRLKESPATLDELQSYMQNQNPEIKRDSIRGKLSYLRTHGLIIKDNNQFEATDGSQQVV